MKQNKQRILIALCILVAVIIIGLVFYSSRSVTENFEEKQNVKETKEATEDSSKDKESIVPKDAKQPTKNEMKLSNKEQEIFTDLLNNKLTDGNIDSLINSGILTENMIEKFLTKMKSPAKTHTVTTEGFEDYDNFTVKGLNPNTHVPKHLRIDAFTGFTSLTPMYATASTTDVSTPTSNRIYSQYY